MRSVPIVEDREIILDTARDALEGADREVATAGDPSNIELGQLSACVHPIGVNTRKILGDLLPA